MTCSNTIFILFSLYDRRQRGWGHGRGRRRQGQIYQNNFFLLTD